jgi:hypothetical protein
MKKDLVISKIKNSCWIEIDLILLIIKRYVKESWFLFWIDSKTQNSPWFIWVLLHLKDIWSKEEQYLKVYNVRTFAINFQSISTYINKFIMHFYLNCNINFNIVVIRKNNYNSLYNHSHYDPFSNYGTIR